MPFSLRRSVTAVGHGGDGGNGFTWRIGATEKKRRSAFDAGAAKRRAQAGQQRAHERARGSALRSCARRWPACIHGLLCRPSASNALSSRFVSVAPFLHVLPLSPSVSVPSDVLQHSHNGASQTPVRLRLSTTTRWCATSRSKSTSIRAAVS